MTETPEARRQRVLEEQRHVSSKISDLCRYIGFGIAAAAYANFSSSSEFATSLMESDRGLVMWASVTAILIIFTDYLQFLCGYISVREAVGNQADDYKYKLQSPFYKGRFVCFVVKQILTALSVALLLTALLRNIS